MTSSSLLQFESPAVHRKSASTANRTTVVATQAAANKVSPSKLNKLEFIEAKSLSEETLTMAENDPMLPRDVSENDSGCCSRKCCPNLFNTIVNCFLYTFCMSRRERDSPAPHQVHEPRPYEHCNGSAVLGGDILGVVDDEMPPLEDERPIPVGANQNEGAEKKESKSEPEPALVDEDLLRKN